MFTRNAYESRQIQHRILADVINQTPSYIIVLDEQDQVACWNKSAEKLFGLDIQTDSGKKLNDICHGLSRLLEEGFRVTRKEDEFLLEKQRVFFNGDNRFFDILVYPLRSDKFEGKVVRIDDATLRVNLEELIK